MQLYTTSSRLLDECMKIQRPCLSEAKVSAKPGDGLKLAGWQKVGSNQSAGILVYSFEQQKYERLTDSGSNPRWLSDNRRLLFLSQGKLQIVDSLTKRVATIMEINPDAFFGFALPKDERLIYFTQASSEIDIWLSEIQ